jgi:hypothetical protein
MQMITRTAECSCGGLKALCSGEPIRVSVCHCLACQRRTGSAFGYQLTFDRKQVEIDGAFFIFTRSSDEGYWARFNFCPTCGSTIFYEIERRPGMITIAGGAFADPALPPPQFSIYEDRRHHWCAIEADGLVRDPAPAEKN